MNRKVETLRDQKSSLDMITTLRIAVIPVSLYSVRDIHRESVGPRLFRLTASRQLIGVGV